MEENETILLTAVKLFNEGLKSKDALHIACAIEADCKYFLTTDDLIIKKMVNKSEIIVSNPIDFLKIIEEK